MTSIESYIKEHVQQVIADHFGISMTKVLLPTRGKERVTWIRTIYAYCLYRFTSMTGAEIGEHIKRDHTMVSHAVKQINERCKVDKEVRADIIEIESLFDDGAKKKNIKYFL